MKHWRSFLEFCILRCIFIWAQGNGYLQIYNKVWGNNFGLEICFLSRKHGWKGYLNKNGNWGFCWSCFQNMSSLYWRKERINITRFGFCMSVLGAFRLNSVIHPVLCEYTKNMLADSEGTIMLHCPMKALKLRPPAWYFFSFILWNDFQATWFCFSTKVKSC